MVMAPKTYTRIVLQERPETDIVPTTFRSEVLPLDLEPKDAQILVKVNWLSLDPAMRGWLRDTRSYLPPVQIGEVMRASGLGTVVKTGRGSKFEIGDIVQATVGELMMSAYLLDTIVISSVQAGQNML
jgi:NADPH-dependent curcumin reductase CurA